MQKKKKSVLGQVKFQIKAQQASPAPPVGPQVGQFGINIMSFCKEFNERTQSYPIGAPVPLILTVYQDKSFTFITKTLPTSYLLLQASRIERAQKVINIQDIERIAESKMPDLVAHTKEAAIRSILGTAKSMKINITS